MKASREQHKKLCSKCRLLRDSRHFSKNRTKPSGLADWCKDCARAHHQKNRDRNRVVRNGYYARNRAKHADDVRSWQKANPEKRAAHIQVRTAVRNGTLLKLPCEVCGDDRAEAHHDDYSKPLVVRWLCRVHHKMLHAGTLEESRHFNA